MMMTGATYSSMVRRSTAASIQSPKDLYGDSDFYTPPIPRDILSQVDYLDIYPGESSRLTRSASSPAPYNNKDAIDPYYGMDNATSYTNDLASGMDSATSSRPTSMGAASTSGMRTPPSLMERSTYERGYSSDMIDPVMMNNLLARNSVSTSNGQSPTSVTPNSAASVSSNAERRFSTADAFASGSVSNGNSNSGTGSNTSQRGFNSALYQSVSLLADRMSSVSVSGNGSGTPNSGNSGAAGQNGNGSVASSPPSTNSMSNGNGYSTYGGTASLPRSASLTENPSRGHDPRVTDYPPCNTL